MQGNVTSDQASNGSALSLVGRPTWRVRQRVYGEVCERFNAGLVCFEYGRNDDRAG